MYWFYFTKAFTSKAGLLLLLIWFISYDFLLFDIIQLLISLSANKVCGKRLPGDVEL